MNETSGVLNETTLTLEMAVVYNECQLTEVCIVHTCYFQSFIR